MAPAQRCLSRQGDFVGPFPLVISFKQTVALASSHGHQRQFFFLPTIHQHHRTETDGSRHQWAKSERSFLVQLGEPGQPRASCFHRRRPGVNQSETLFR
jgi:hypothetical protein